MDRKELQDGEKIDEQINEGGEGGEGGQDNTEVGNENYEVPHDQALEIEVEDVENEIKNQKSRKVPNLIPILTPIDIFGSLRSLRSISPLTLGFPSVTSTVRFEYFFLPSVTGAVDQGKGGLEHGVLLPDIILDESFAGLLNYLNIPFDIIDGGILRIHPEIKIVFGKHLQKFIEFGEIVRDHIKTLLNLDVQQHESNNWIGNGPDKSGGGSSGNIFASFDQPGSSQLRNPQNVTETSTSSHNLYLQENISSSESFSQSFKEKDYVVKSQNLFPSAPNAENNPWKKLYEPNYMKCQPNNQVLVYNVQEVNDDGANQQEESVDQSPPKNPSGEGDGSGEEGGSDEHDETAGQHCQNVPCTEPTQDDRQVIIGQRIELSENLVQQGQNVNAEQTMQSDTEQQRDAQETTELHRKRKIESNQKAHLIFTKRALLSDTITGSQSGISEDPQPVGSSELQPDTNIESQPGTSGTQNTKDSLLRARLNKKADDFSKFAIDIVFTPDMYGSEQERPRRVSTESRSSTLSPDMQQGIMNSLADFIHEAEDFQHSREHNIIRDDTNIVEELRGLILMCLNQYRTFSTAQLHMCMEKYSINRLDPDIQERLLRSVMQLLKIDDTIAVVEEYILTYLRSSTAATENIAGPSSLTEQHPINPKIDPLLKNSTPPHSDSSSE